MNIYRINGMMMNEQVFREKICNALINYNYASIKDLSLVLKAKPMDIEKELNEIIVNYIKQNPDKTYAEVCMELFVRSEFIEKLIAEGRLEIKSSGSLDGIKALQEEVSKQTTSNIKEAQKREAISGLQGTMSRPKIIIKEDNNGPRFYTKK